MRDARYDFALTGRRYKPGMTFGCEVAVPPIQAEAYALLIDHDGLNEAHVQAMARLGAEGKAPPCVCVGVKPGYITMPDGSQRPMRMNSYDLFDREYGDFLVHELIPQVEKACGVRFAASPDWHLVSGGSSGAISAFAIAWFHPEVFHRLYMSSPSFLAMGRGNEIPYLIRKCETKPLRVYEEYSENEPNDYFGWSRPIDEEARAALTFAGYDFQCRYFAGEGHCSRYRDEAEAYARLEWLWQGWQTEPVRAAGQSPRLDAILPRHSRWERCEAMPVHPAAEAPACLAEMYDRLVLSSDGLAWYAGNGSEDTVYMIVNDGDFRPEKRLVQAMLHTLPHQVCKGAIDLAVDAGDRLYVLTEMGVQCVRSFGLIDGILDLPQEGVPRRIAVADALYVQTDAGVYRRTLCPQCLTPGGEKRRHIGYYD